jgi:hypothetical protein
MTDKHGFWNTFSQECQKRDGGLKYLRKVDEYEGQKNFVLACTQQDNCTASEQKKIVKEWCDLFKSQQLSIDKLWVSTRISQQILDAICHQKTLNGLWIKWGVYNDISALENITNLEYLRLGGGSSLDNIDVLSKLKTLKALETKKLFKICDYSLLSGLKNLIDLAIEGDPYSQMKKVTLKSLNFLKDMPQLIRLSLCMTKIEDRSYAPIIDLPNLRFLSLPKDRDLDKDIDKLKKFLE